MEHIEQRVTQIINDREHGSRWLLREALVFLRDLAQETSEAPPERLRLLYTCGWRIMQARPAMAALASALSQVLGPQDDPASIAQVAQQVLESYDTAPARIAEQAQPLLHGQIMTCSLSGTVLDVFIAQREQIAQVVVLEGRPRYEGRVLAQALSQHAIPVTLITDAQAAIFLPQCQAVVVGADSVLINGDVLNKAGTALLAWAAHGQAIPLYVLCETLKISPQRWHEHDPARQQQNLHLLEEKEPEEVLEQALPGVTVRNFYFDRTPYRLVGKLVTEQGILDRPAVREIAVATRSNQRLLMHKQK